MQITALQIENFKRLKAVSITPEGNTVVIAGANAQGKSSVLDSIWAALAGKKGAVSDPVRHGEDQASVSMTLGELVVTKTWRPDGKATLVVESKAGARFPSPQAVLDTMLGEFSFDPLAFAHAKPKDQRDALLQLVGLDLDALDQERRGYFDQRTDVNREVKRLDALLASLPKPPAGTPDEPVNFVDTFNAMNTLRDAKGDYDHAVTEFQTLQREIAVLQGQAEEMRQRGMKAYDRMNGILGISDPAVSVPAAADAKIEALERQARESTDINEAVRLKRMRETDEAALRGARGAADQLSKAIEEVDQRKQQAVASAGLPVDGLGFDENGVLLNGVAFEQASAAEKLRTSVAIAMAANPTIRVIRITDGSLLDSKNLALIEEMAAEKDFQIWVEKVDETGNVGIVIEDGEVVA